MPQRTMCSWRARGNATRPRGVRRVDQGRTSMPAAASAGHEAVEEIELALSV